MLMLNQNLILKRTRLILRKGLAIRNDLFPVPYCEFRLYFNPCLFQSLRFTRCAWPCQAQVRAWMAFRSGVTKRQVSKGKESAVRKCSTVDSPFSLSQFSRNSPFSPIFVVYQTWRLLLNITWRSHITQVSHVFAADQKYDQSENWLYFQRRRGSSNRGKESLLKFKLTMEIYVSHPLIPSLLYDACGGQERRIAYISSLI